MRSYWALVNQFSNYYATQPHLAPFRELMKKNTKWHWDEVLQTLFEQSRLHIAEKIQEGSIWLLGTFLVSTTTSVCWTTSTFLSTM